MYLRISRTNFRAWAIKGAAFIAVAGIAARIFLFPHATDAAWFDDSYGYRQKVTIGNSGAADSNKKVKLDVDTASLISAGKMRSDCADTRFTDANGKLLKYYIDSSGGACDTASTDYYVFLSTINGSSNATIIFMYYGFDSASPGTQPSQLPVATFSPTSGPSFASEERGATPVLYWKFDEGSGTDIHDSAASGKNYGFVSNITWPDTSNCISGGCLQFSGSGSAYRPVVGITNSDLMFGSDSFSLSIWARHSATITAQEDIIAKWSRGGRGLFANGVQVYMDSSGLYCAVIQDEAGNTDDTICSSASYADNKWHNVQFVKSGTSSITLYVDGAAVASDSSLTSTAGIGDASTQLAVGANTGDGDGNTDSWTGYADEFKVYEYAKTDAQIKAEMNAKGTADGVSATLGTSDQSFLSNGLVGYWKMDESGWTNDCSTASVIDSSGNGVNAKACPNGTAPSPTAGKFGNAVSLNGSQYIDAGSGFGYTSSFSVSAWVYLNNATSRQDDIISTMGGSSTRGWSLINDFGSFSVYLASTASTTHYTGSSTALQNNRWYHVAMVYNSANPSLDIYVDGTRDTVAVDSIPNVLYNAGNNLNIGRSPLGSNYTSGKIDDVRIYNHALSDHEVRSLYDWAPGPMGYWNLDEKTGITAKDVSGNGHDGTLTNGPKWTTGKVGGALSFDNDDDYVTMGDNLDLDSKNFTILAWAKRNDTATGDVVVAKKNGAGSGNSGYAIYCGTGSTCTAYIADGSAEFTVSGTMGSAGEWHHIALVVDRSANSATKFYSDGIETTTSRSGTIDTLGSLGTAASLRIGRYSNSTFPFNGQIDNVKIYDSALTPRQITAELNSGHPAVGSPIASAIGHWKFDEGTDNTCSGGTNDVCNAGSAGSAIDGAQTNMAVPGTSTSGWTASGKFSKAIIFDGSNDRLDMGTSSTLNITGQTLTFSSWIKRASSSQQGVLVGRGTAGANGYAIGIGNIQGSGCTTNQIAVGKFGVSWGCLSSFPADTNWHHLVVTLNSSGERAYVDGSLVASNTDTGSIASSSNNFRLGIGTDGASLFAGSMDEVKVYNYDLSADDVKTEYNQGKVQVLGSVSTESDGTTASTSTSREYCVPGESSGTCTYPVNQWSFDEGTGTSGYDTGSNANNATLANGTSWVAGKVGKALSFDGCSGCNQDDNASISSHTLPTVMTIEAWVYPKTTGEGGLGRILDNASDVTLFLNSSNANRLEFSAVWSTTNGNWYMTPALTYNQWSHVIVTYDYGSTSNTPTFYVNGVKQTTNTGSSSPSGTHSLTAHTTYIGNNSSGTRTWDGYIDSVKIFNYARNATQVAWDYNRGGPVGWWKFDECQGTTANDASGNGWNGTINIGGTSTYTSAGTCSSGTSTEAWNAGTTGKYNSAMAFDGTDDAVNAGDHDILRYISISAWVYSNSLTTGDGIVSKRTANEVSGDWALRLDGNTASGKLEWNVWNGVDSAKTVTSTGAISSGSWNHVVATFDDTANTTKLYINGRLDTTDTTTVTYDLADVPESIQIGYAGQSATSQTWNGLIDDVQIYNYVLTENQVKTIYNNRSAVRFGPNTGSP